MTKLNELKTKQTGRHVDAKYYYHIKYFLCIAISNEMISFTPDFHTNWVFFSAQSNCDSSCASGVLIKLECILWPYFIV